MMEDPEEPVVTAAHSDAVEELKDSMRESLLAHQKECRQARINKNRAALGEITEDSSLTPAFVTAKARALLKKPLSIEEYRQLQNSLIQNEENVNAFFKVHNALNALVRDMSSINPELQLCAANCCCNLALGNAKACTTLAKSISAYLLIILEGCNRPMMEVALWTIGNMVTGCKIAFDILHAQNAFKHLLYILKDCDNVILPSIAYAIVHYFYTGYNYLSDEDKLQLIKLATNRKFDDSDPAFLWLLALLSSIESSNIYFCNLLPLIVDLLFVATSNNIYTVSKITAYIRIIGNSVVEESGTMASIFLNNDKYSTSDLSTLLNHLLCHQYTNVRKETLWLIGNLYNHNQECVTGRMKEILPGLTQINLGISALG